MIHYSCDRCHKKIDANEVRYIVRIEVQLAIGDGTMDELDDSSMEELEELLESIEPDQLDEQQHTSEKKFDLCSRCYAEYIDNPLAIETVGFGFSKN